MLSLWIHTIQKRLQSYAPQHPNKSEAFFYALSFLDAILLPIPLEFLYVFFVTALPDRKWRMAVGAIVVGSLAGLTVYFFGYWVSSLTQKSQWLNWIMSPETQLQVLTLFKKYALWLIVLKPPAVLIPYKILAFFSGYTHMPLMTHFIPAMVLGKMRLLLLTWWIARSSDPQRALTRIMSFLKVVGLVIVGGLVMSCVRDFFVRTQRPPVADVEKAVLELVYEENLEKVLVAAEQQEALVIEDILLMNTL